MGVVLCPINVFGLCTPPTLSLPRVMGEALLRRDGGGDP